MLKKLRDRPLFAGIVLLVVAGCVAIAASHVLIARTAGDPRREEWKKLYARPTQIPYPDDDPYSNAKAQLGEMLFFDPLLSGSRTRSCASCHMPSLSFADEVPRAIGEGREPLPFRTPSILNIAWIPALGWDGKFHNLESVAFGPLSNAKNMNRNEPDLIRDLSQNAGYRKLFTEAFGGGAITRHQIEQALATYERTIVSGKAPFDRWIEGDEGAISESAKRGFDLFNGKANCAACHTGWNFTDGAFYDIGVSRNDEPGRGKYFPTSVKLQHAFKVPTLRDSARRLYFMHNGSMRSLAEVLNSYEHGGTSRPSRSELIKPLDLSKQDEADLTAFLQTLSAEPASYAVPNLPR